MWNSIFGYNAVNLYSGCFLLLSIYSQSSPSMIKSIFSIIGVADRNPLLVRNGRFCLKFFFCPAPALHYTIVHYLSYVYKTSLTSYENLGQKERKTEGRKEGRTDESRYRVAPQLKRKIDTLKWGPPLFPPLMHTLCSD